VINSSSLSERTRHEVTLNHLALLDQVLLLERGIDQLVLHRALADEHFADPVPFSGLAALFLEALLQRQAFLELAPCERAALDQQARPGASCPRAGS